MKKIAELKRNHVILFAIMVILVLKLLTTTFGTLLKHLTPIDLTTNFGFMLVEFFVFLVALFLIHITSQKLILKQGFTGFFKSLCSGMVFFGIVALGCLVFTTEGITNNAEYKSFPEILFFILFVLLVGLAEEFIFRGIIADSILQRFGHSPAGIIFTVISSSILFGLFHFFNFFSGQALEETFVQIIATSMTGCLLGAIYVRHKNIYAVAFLHAVLDFMTMFEDGFLVGNSIQYEKIAIDFVPRLIQALKSQSVFVIAAIFVLRPKILKKLVKESR